MRRRAAADREQPTVEPKPADHVRLVQIDSLRPEGYDGTCLRPLGLCDLGGCCDVCWYRPDHPRFWNDGNSEPKR